MFEKHLPSCTAILGASLLLTASLSLAGCSGAMVATPAASAVAVNGNWQVSSAAASASKLSSLSGELKGSSTSMTGIFHSNASSACVAPAQSFEVSGKADANSMVSLTGTLMAGGKLTITGTLAADGKSLANAKYNVTGGACAFAKPADATAQAYTSIDGQFTGNFVDSDGQSIPVVANMTQNPNSDTDGNFQMSGSGTFPNNPCFSSTASITNSQVTGGQFDVTYTDPVTANSVEALGNFSTDGKTLTVTHWQLTGSCGPDTGTGLMTKN